MKQKIIKDIKENLWFIISLLFVLIIFYVELPYLVYTPGDISDVNNRIVYDFKKEFKGSFNMASVKGLKSNIFFIGLANIIPSWDAVKADRVKLENETINQMNNRDRLMLIEGNNNALTVALDEAKISYEKTNIVHEITYLTNESKTNLQVGDQIILVDNQKIDNLSSLIEHINTLEVGDKVNILVKRNDQEKNLTAEVYLFQERKMIGVMLSTLFDLKLDFKLELKTENRESGGSGGLMTALAVYNNLTQKDLTNGRKIVGTGTIDAAGNVGLIGGVKYKLIGAVKNNADLFIVPKNNLKEALEYKKKYDYKIEIIGVNTFREAVELLNVS